MEVGLTQNGETMALRMLTFVDLFYFITCEGKLIKVTFGWLLQRMITTLKYRVKSYVSLQLRLGKHNYMWTWIFQTKIGWRVIAKVDWNLKHWMHWCNCHCAIFWWKTWIYWARIFDTWKSTINTRVLPLDLDDDYVHYVLVHHFIACTSSI